MRSSRLVAALLSTFMLTACDDNPQTPVTSTLLRNAVVYDGTGADPYDGSVRIDSSTQRIVAVGDLAPLAGETVYDVEGLALAPGFIDSHSHHDQEMDKYRHMPGVLSQGVTTIVRGMDGFAIDETTVSYRSVAEYNERLETNPAAVNIASYSPHNSIRWKVMGDDYRRHATDDELSAMAKLLDADMQAGALGLSTGLEYEPSMFSSTEEVISLARVAAASGGRYATHIRDEDDQVMAAIEEALRVGSAARIPVQISHIKLADRAMWGTTDAVLQALDRARADGVSVTADVYPYLRWAANLAILFPERDYSKREDAEYTFEHSASPEDILILDFPSNSEFNGLTVAEIAKMTERDVEDTLMDLAQKADEYRAKTDMDGSLIIAKGMNESDLATFMQWPHTSICSDGWHGGHPRGYGSFPRVLGRYVRDLGLLSLPAAIHKMTGLTAAAHGIEDRGLIRAGQYADIVIFDPQTIIDYATMDNPTAQSSGIRNVWVNGVLAFDDGEPTRAYSGQVIRRPL